VGKRWASERTICVAQGGVCTYERGCAVPEALQPARICHLDTIVYASPPNEKHIAQYQPHKIPTATSISQDGSQVSAPQATLRPARCPSPEQGRPAHQILHYTAVRHRRPHALYTRMKHLSFRANCPITVEVELCERNWTQLPVASIAFNHRILAGSQRRH
jgi:hypothetical protein